MNRLQPPQPVDLVPAEDVRAIIVATDRDLAALETRLAEVQAVAEQDEAQARELGVDGRASTWAMVRMQRFLDGMKAEGDREINAMLAIANDRAAARIAEARAEADSILNGANPTWESPQPELPRPDTRRAAETPAESQPESPPQPVRARLAPVPAPTPVEVTPADVAPAEVPSSDAAARADVDLHVDDVTVQPAEHEAGVSIPTVFDHDSAAVDPAPGRRPAAADAAPVELAHANAEAVRNVPPTPPASDPIPVVWIAPPSASVATEGDGTALSAPAVAAPSSPVALAVAEPEHMTTLVDPMSEPATTVDSANGFWPEAPPKRKGFLHRVPISAILEVLAVLLILVFILLRLS